MEKDDSVAAIFLLKARNGYRDQGPAEVARVAVKINIPAPLKPEDYAKLITVAPIAPPDLFLGGGRGGGKSHRIAIPMLRHAEQYGSAARILLSARASPA